MSGAGVKLCTVKVCFFASSARARTPFARLPESSFVHTSAPAFYEHLPENVALSSVLETNDLEFELDTAGKILKALR